MTVGTLKLRIFIPDARSLKQKRAVVKKILERSKSRFNISVAEVGDNDIHTVATLGFVTVGKDSRRVNSRLDKLLNFIEGLFLAQILDSKIEITHF